MDITAVFRACVETLRQQNKELGFLNPESQSSPTGAKSRIFPTRKSEYITKARELSATITSLRDFLKENRNAYLNIGASSNNKSYLKDSVFFASSSNSKRSNTTPVPVMSDLERDQIDSDVQKIISNCQKRIFEYERLLQTTDSIRKNTHLVTYLENVAVSLSVYLKDVTKGYSEMRAIRVKRTVDYQAMSRLSSGTSSSSSSSGFNKSNKSHLGERSKPKMSERNALTIPESEVDGHGHGNDQGDSSTVPDYFLEEEIPPEELQLLEEENAALLNELNSLANEVDQIQSNVVQIAQLQEIFTEKVLQQDKDVEKIANVVVGATENIKGGNEQIRQAIQKNADFRAWVLFFILVMAFSLLFLDWYND